MTAYSPDLYSSYYEVSWEDFRGRRYRRKFPFEGRKYGAARNAARDLLTQIEASAEIVCERFGCEPPYGNARMFLVQYTEQVV